MPKPGAKDKDLTTAKRRHARADALKERLPSLYGSRTGEALWEAVRGDAAAFLENMPSREEIGNMPRKDIKALIQELDDKRQHLESLIKREVESYERARASIRVLGEAFQMGRQDERVRILELEDERKRKIILTMQRELNMMRGESADNVGWDKERYFRALGKSLDKASEELLDIADSIKNNDDTNIRVAAVKLEMMGASFSEFADNAEAYADEARERNAAECKQNT